MDRLMAKKKNVFTPNNNNFAIAYYRYSSHEQNDASIEQQQEAAQGYASAHGYTIIAEYADRAKSGTQTENRYEYQRMLKEIDRLRPHALILWKKDRLGRDRYELTDAKRRIRNAGCRLEMVAEATPEETPEGAILDSLSDGMAEWYSLYMSQNIQRGMHYNASQFLFNGHKLLGFGVDATKHYVIDPVTAPVVERIFNDYVQGKRMKDIADELNAEGRRTTRGYEFTNNSIRSIINNPCYKGTYHESGVVAEHAIPSIVSDELWDAAQSKLQANKRLGKGGHTVEPRYWLTGKLYCGECGESMGGEYAVSKTKRKYFYYRCTNSACDMKRISKERIESLVLDGLREILHSDGNRAWLAADASRYYKEHFADTSYLDSLKDELKSTEKAIKSLLNVLETGVVSPSLVERLEALDARKTALSETIEVEKARKALADDDMSIKAYFEKFANADLDDERTRDAILEYFVDKIYVYDDHLKITGLFADRSTSLTFADWRNAEKNTQWRVLPPGVTEFDNCAFCSTRQLPAGPETDLLCLYRTKTSGEANSACIARMKKRASGTFRRARAPASGASKPSGFAKQRRLRFSAPPPDNSQGLYQK